MTHQVIRGIFVAAALLAAAQVAAAQVASQPKSDPKYIAKARADSAQYPYTEADIHFMKGMIHHHAQAIEMSKLAPTNGASPAVLTLTGRIINAQNDEIALMSNWLRDRNQEVPEAKGGPMKMNHGGMMHEMLMPGMLSEEEMKDLAASRGKDFDIKFLRGMIKHHNGAVEMVKELMGTYGAAQDVLTAKLAQDVQIDQLTEIERMQKMLLSALCLIEQK
jgi:uncharacterized protein (DUF305 family)